MRLPVPAGVLGPAVALTLIALGLSAAPALAGSNPAAGDVPPPTAADQQVLVNEMANGGPGGTQLNDDFAEIRNWGTDPVDISGWTISPCTSGGNRTVNGAVTVAAGTTLAPGALYTIAFTSALPDGPAPDARYTVSLSASDYGIYIEDENRNRIDSIASGPTKPWASQSDCDRGNVPDLPNTLNFIAGDSWQRVANTGNTATDWIRGKRTPAVQNTTTPVIPFTHLDGIYIDEITASSVANANDGFVELKNYGTEPVDLAGWKTYKCITTGRLLTTYLQDTIAATAASPSTIIAPGGTYTLGHRTGFSGGFGTGPGQAQNPLATTFDKKTYGTALQAPDGQFVAGAAVSADNIDSACQEGDTKLPSTVDFGAMESWQRVARSGDAQTDWVLAPRTPNAPNATATNSIAAQSAVLHGRDGVRVSELATDPDAGLPAGSPRNNYVELGNYSSSAIDVSGWKIRTCAVDGTRTLAPVVTIGPGTVLNPGQTYTAARAGTTVADHAQATYATPFDLMGAGVWISDANDTLIDNVGMYTRHTGDVQNVAFSPCSQGQALTTYLPDRPSGETFQRSRFTGDNRNDFQVGPATPGVIDEHPYVDPTVPMVGATDPVSILTSHPTDTPVTSAVRSGGKDALTAAVADQDASDVLGMSIRGGRRIDLRTHVTSAFSGASDGVLTTREGTDETPVSADALATASDARPVVAEDDAYRYPYQRFVLAAGSGADELKAGSELVWTGATEGRNELQLSVWNTATATWRRVDAQTASRQGRVTLTAPLVAGDVADGRIDVLVQDGPRTKPTLSSAIRPQFQDPGAYDFSFVHFTDAQYLTESYPQVYTGAVSWILANREARKIAFVANTGDMIQNYVLADESPVRANAEFLRASKIQKLLDDAQLSNSVLPGNHDDSYARDNSLYNQYFPPSRYAGDSWYGGSVTPTDNSTNYTTFERAGAKFVVLSLGYGYSQADLEFAQAVVAAHQDANVIVATHEHVTPMDDRTALPADRVDGNNRWNSRGDVLWNTLIAPNRNVVMVLSGHLTGVGKITTENAGGIPGHSVVEMVADYQEHRTNDGARATGFDRLLQVDLGSGTVAVNTYSQPLNAYYSYPYDYPLQASSNTTDSITALSNERPWNIVSAGAMGRYSEMDDEFVAKVGLQYAKSVKTAGVELVGDAAVLSTGTATGSGTVKASWPDSATAPLSAQRVWWATATDIHGATVASAPVVNAAGPAASTPSSGGSSGTVAETAPVSAAAPSPNAPNGTAPSTAPAKPATATFARSAKVTIAGRAIVGKSLTVRLVGSWSPKPTKVTYRWYRGGRLIKGATKPTFKVTKADRGKRITVKVTAARTGYVTTTVAGHSVLVRR